MLEDLGRLALARRDYAAIVAHDPTHRGALINGATMDFVDGRPTAALALYRRAAAAYADDVVSLADLGNVLAEIGAFEESRAAYEAALRCEPDHAVAHYGLARLLEERGDAAAVEHRARAFATPIVAVTRSSSATPLHLLVATAADGGNLVTTLFFDERAVETTTLVMESYRPTWPLPPHDLIVNAVADADRSGAALHAVDALLAASGRPCINPPATVRATDRRAMMHRLRTVPGVLPPRTERFTRAACTVENLAAAKFRYPLLLRAPGFHAGRHLVRVAAAAELVAQCATLPGEELLAIAFIDTRDAAGRYRKYRMLMIDGALVPLHLAVARNWMVHYFASDNAVRGESRDLEKAYLANPRAHLGEGAYAALEAVRDAVGLDYGGIDFSLDASGRVVVFEANASFAIYYPGDDATAAYRRPFTDATIAAVRAMIRTRALRGRAMMREDGALDHGEHLFPT